MRFEDRDALFEAAFAKIEPKTEAEREKLASLREKIRESTASMAKIREDLKKNQALRNAGSEARATEGLARARAWEAAREAFLAKFEEQADLIERIVVLRGSGSSGTQSGDSRPI